MVDSFLEPQHVLLDNKFTFVELKVGLGSSQLVDRGFQFIDDIGVSAQLLLIRTDLSALLKLLLSVLLLGKLDFLDLGLKDFSFFN